MRPEDNLQVIANLSPATNRADVLAVIAEWHEARKGTRHRYIAQALRTASGTAANDNRPARRERRAA